jgi:hypothetical protein
MMTMTCSRGAERQRLQQQQQQQQQWTCGRHTWRGCSVGRLHPGAARHWRTVHVLQQHCAMVFVNQVQKPKSVLYARFDLFWP